MSTRKNSGTIISPKLPEPDDDHAESVMRQRGDTIRATAKELMTKHKFDQVTALINAALRNGYTQPWMYEGLALAMQAKRQPKEEIERALMSAVDFAKVVQRFDERRHLHGPCRVSMLERLSYCAKPRRWNRFVTNRTCTV